MFRTVTSAVAAQVPRLAVSGRRVCHCSARAVRDGSGSTIVGRTCGHGSFRAVAHSNHRLLAPNTGRPREMRGNYFAREKHPSYAAHRPLALYRAN